MPLPNDAKVLALSNELLATFEKIFGAHPGFRPAHAKGILLTGSFAATEAARKVTKAEHVQRDSVQVVARFSNSTGIPVLPDTDPNADPRGLAIRFYLGEHVHTDIVSHAAKGFPTRTGEEFLEFLKVVSSGDQAQIGAFVGSHPMVAVFVQMPKPAPASFATEQYFGVTAMRFTNAGGQSRFGRYQIVPEAGVEHAVGKSPEYLFEEIQKRVAAAPVRFRIQVQLANEGDAVDDATKQWPDDREVVEFGTLELNRIAPEQVGEQKKIIFDPIPRIDGIDPSADPLLELRAAIYLISGRKRRQAEHD